jgi:hypothetical protein
MIVWVGREVRIYRSSIPSPGIPVGIPPPKRETDIYIGTVPGIPIPRIIIKWIVIIWITIVDIINCSGA